MKLHILSDLHLEIADMRPSPESQAADVIVLAGDIASETDGLHWARQCWPKHEIVYVPGNHEFYGGVRTDTLKKMRAVAAELGIHLLDSDEVVIDGVRFLGATLWTDFLYQGEELRLASMIFAEKSLADFRLIMEKEGRYSRPFTPRDSINLHESAVAWLEAKLGEPFAGPTVVVTHHLPSDRSVAERYKQGALTGCFASHLDRLLGRSELWIHGHTHDSSFYEVNGTTVVCNPRGYSRPGRPIENLCFADLIVEVEKGRACLASPAPLTLAEVNAALESVERGSYLLSGGGTLSYASLDDLPIPLKNKLLVAVRGSACPNIPGVKDAIYWTDWVRLSGQHTKS